MRGSLMRLWTKEQHLRILAANPDNGDAAAAYSADGQKPVNANNVRYWRKLFGENAGNLARTDREIAEERKLRSPLPDDDIPKTAEFPVHSTCILVIPDMHAPYEHKDALDFLAEVAAKFQPDTIVNLGDELDFHALSFHDSDPNLDSAGTELEKAKETMQRLHALFPEMMICHSNHGSMVFRKAKHAGIPVQAIKSYREVLFPDSRAPGWAWAEKWKINTALGPILFKHQASGDAVGDAAHNRCNLIVGHEHGKFGVTYAASTADLYYGAYSGCLIDKESYAFAYGKHSLKKPIIGCTVVLDGKPIPVPMVLNSNGRWRGYL